MQVFGLLGDIVRNGRVASRLLDAQSSHIEAARRCDAVGRWRRAIADGLAAGEATRTVGVPRSTLYRREKLRSHRAAGRTCCASRNGRANLPRPWRGRAPTIPCGGKRKIAVLIRREGFQTSASTVGRIVLSLVG